MYTNTYMFTESRTPAPTVLTLYHYIYAIIIYTSVPSVESPNVFLGYL